MIILKIHSSVDVITNSSTVIFTYQDSIEEVKALVEEIINLSGEKEITPDDVFYYGVFCENETYAERLDDWDDEKPEGFPEVTANWGDDDGVTYRQQRENRDKWINDIKVSVMKGEIEKPDWMTTIEEEEGWSYYEADRYLNLIPKDEKYKNLSDKLISFLNSPNHEATRDG